MRGIYYNVATFSNWSLIKINILLLNRILPKILQYNQIVPMMTLDYCVTASYP